MKLIGYVRTSVQGKGDSLEAQTEAITAWCKEQGHELLYVRRDDGRSGTLDSSERAGLATALSDLAEQAAEGLVMHRLDRLGRALHVQEAILARVWEHGGHVWSAVEGEVLRDDPDDPMRTFARQVMGAAAQLERGMIVARMQGGRRRRRKQGGYIGGDATYGYRLAEERGTGKKRLVPAPKQQQVIRRVKGLRTRGWTYQRIADKLNRDRVPAPAGGRWYAMTVQRATTR
jgi:DNA invertase Pin-like site-specific DNA recombinase